MKFTALATRFLGEKVAKLAEETRLQYTYALNNHIIPRLKHLHATKITRADITKLHAALRDKPYMANRCVAILSSLFNWAADEGHTPEGYNPANRIHKYTEYEKERFLSPQEYEALGKCLAEHKDKYFVGAVLLLIYTGCRKTEVLKLRWDQVVFSYGCVLHLKRKRKITNIKLNDEAMQVLTILQQYKTGKYVVPGRDKSKPRNTIQKQWDRLRLQCGLEDVRIHDLRHSFAAQAANGGQSLLVIGKLLGHTDVRSTKRYAHLSDRATSEAGNTVAKEIGKMVRCTLS
jgi:integrase